MHLKRQTGFTLIELMVTLAVAVVLITVGVPNFMSLVTSSRAAGAANDLVASLNSARVEAVKRGQRISMCASTNGTSCATSSDWGSGWIVFKDSAATDTAALPGSLASSDIITVRGTVGSGINVNANSTAYIRFNAMGMSSASSSFVLSPTAPRCTSGSARQVAINAAGRVQISTVACPP